MLRVSMRVLAAVLGLLLASSAHPAFAQDPPPLIPWVIVDLHGSLPRLPSDDAQLAESRGMNVAELPGSGLGMQLGLHLYPLHTRLVTVGVGGELATGRARQTPPAGATVKSATGVVTPLRAAEERITSLSPQLSLNFGNGSGWSYLSVGLGQTTWSIAPADLVDYPPNSDKLKTLNYGGGGRWFIRPHVAFSFDVRFYAINPGTAAFNPGTTIVFPGTPRTTLLIIGAGISLK
jgi:hypothetical protein